ncbi:hypothetical protein D1BOALGB6SA_3609 [Olavius sp. associated proteobacterium Delta 1]|nr:hypothetical protein D1BOALGB6SA_3609 [Olavius sp. associated proteobacterium Delta 1]
MVRFPIFKSLSVKEYGLYPGTNADRKGLEATFQPGLTLVLGANGLGKTTLVWIIYRLLSGPYDIPGLDTGGDLGTRRLKSTLLRGTRLKLFSNRVADYAQNAVAHLSFGLGKHSISVTRRLSDLSLLNFSVDNEELSSDEINSYQTKIAEMAGVWSFGDWILLLRHLTFYFEDRRELVWDATAQRQILRILFLPADSARNWTESERRVLELDSQTRNMGAVLRGRERRLKKIEKMEDSSIDVHEELKSLVELQEVSEQQRNDFDEQALEVDAERRKERLNFLKAEQDRENAFRALEKAKLMVLKEHFPSASETAAYLFAHLITESECLVCGNDVPEVASSLESRIVKSQCIVCGSSIQTLTSEDSVTTDLSDERLKINMQRLAKAERRVKDSGAQLRKAEAAYQEVQNSLHELDTTISRRRDRIESLLQRLPPEEAELHQQRKELSSLHQSLEVLKRELDSEREKFVKFISSVKDALLRSPKQIQENFEKYAQAFLVEECSLVWSQRGEKVGQLGPVIEFPVFEMDMTSASFHSPVRRSGPDQVSESQREFIDLAFRMALMAAADPEYGATLVIDAPESSLDAVFTHRAAEVLGRFASSEQDNRLLVTSNLSDGKFVPQLLAECGHDDLDDVGDRLIDLFEVAEPTAAVRSLIDEYKKARENAFAQSGHAK